MLDGVIQAKFDRIYELFPRVILLKQALALTFVVDAAESFLVRIVNLVLRLHPDLLDRANIDIDGRRLASQLLDQVPRSINIRLAAMVAFKELVLVLGRYGSCHLIVRLVHALKIPILRINHIEAGGKEGVTLIWNGDQIRRGRVVEVMVHLLGLVRRVKLRPEGRFRLLLSCDTILVVVD